VSSSDSLRKSPASPADGDVDRRGFLFAVLPAALATVAVASAARGEEKAGPLAPLPAADAVLSRLVFGACHKLDRPFGVWDAMLALKPQLFLFMGDTIYKDTIVMDEKRAEYAKLAAVPEFARFRQRVPILATWDDHDYGENDGGADYPKRDEAQQVFLDFFAPGAADDVRRKRPGLYEAHVFGAAGRRTQVIVLDTRYFRSKLKRDEVFGGYAPNRDPAATMLGDVQWTWLAEQLKRPAELRLICSSIPVLHEEQPNEKWDNLPLERARLFKVIAESKACGVVLLSGDRHRGEMSRGDVGGDAGAHRHRLFAVRADVERPELSVRAVRRAEPASDRGGVVER
jgi:alkaline phosphatase D